MRGEHVGKVGTTLLLVGGFVAKAGAAGSFDPMVHMMRNLFTTTYTDGDACPAEDAACLASTSCLACNEAYIAAFSGCAASLTSTSTCDDLVDAMCCAVEGCEDNEEFADIMGCINADIGCGYIDLGDCSTAISGSDTTTDSTSTTETDCPTEISACNADDECVTCTQSYVDAVEGCFASATGSTCDDVEESVCCAVDGCEDNEALNDLLVCINAESTCSIDIGDCAEDGSRGISDSDTTTDTDDAVIDTTTDSPYTSMTTSETDCPTEISACNADDECVTCTQSYVEAVDGCFAAVTGSTCDDVEEAVCCAVDGCEDNEALSDLLTCINEDSTCQVDIEDCAADGSRDISGSDTTTDTDPAIFPSTPTTTTSTTDTDTTTPGGTETTSMTTSETDCPTELAACSADSECIACTESYVAAVEGCLAAVTGSTCDGIEEAVCCAVDGCEDNDALNDLLGCLNADTCPIDIGDCDSSVAISDEEGEADAGNTESSATPSAVAMGGSTAVWLIAAVAPILWRQFQ
ncbi:hypothetical protein Esi_0259_0031 [Ectocarpus siliculosus]|uniref:Uncharacterized protein n=1 Tax=Ectocarpus siliculosus TaxID=2880 RepID=D7FTV5_ECTSI|nr:hypothetical protein Esi_0259_0031 [Ectocarpus siliculosus]|eukprot:CBJ31482.1 hypothetical protein Esi_0259_0031 [Ectocarpus siliculosus]